MLTKNVFSFFFLTEESLKNLQKSIHPLAIKKLKGLLDLKEELSLASSERAFDKNGQNSQNGQNGQNSQNDKDIKQKEIVYLAATARTRNSPKGKTGMKYHEKKGCFKANSHIAIEEAESFGHSPCRKCLKPLNL